MKPDQLLRDIQNQLNDSSADKSDLAQSLASLNTAYQKQSRQLDRLTKLSDSTEAKLSQTNSKLEKLLRNLSRFVPDAVVAVLMREGAEQLPANSREKITVFFSDIVGFTGITERLEPERLAPLMTDYFTQMTEICTKWGGTLDQFIGDAIVIFFGAPASHGTEEDAVRAVGMATDMQNRLETLRTKWASEGMSLPFEVRMGIATGYCNVGNFGSHERLHYTAIGTAVNSAARIQSLSPPNEVMMAEDTYMLIRDHYKCDEDQIVTLQGHQHPTKLFKLRAGQQDNTERSLAASADGYRFYFDPQEVTDKEQVRALLEQALHSLDQDSQKTDV